MQIILTEEEEKAIKSLKRLAKKWPSSLWLFAGNNDLHIMKNGPSGRPAMTETGCVDPNYSVATVDIDNEGGGW